MNSKEISTKTRNFCCWCLIAGDKGQYFEIHELPDIVSKEFLKYIRKKYVALIVLTVQC